MATSGAQLRALTMAANAVAQESITLARQAQQKAAEAEQAYRAISIKLNSSALFTRHAQEQGYEVAISNLHQAISEGEQYAAMVA